MKKEVIILSCDGCGETQTEELSVTPHTLTFDKMEYAIDLCDYCLKDEREYHKIRGKLIKNPRIRTAASRLESAAKRQWALEHGYEIAPRGRIPASAEKAYENRNKKHQALGRCWCRRSHTMDEAIALNTGH